MDKRIFVTLLAVDVRPTEHNTLIVGLTLAFRWLLN